MNLQGARSANANKIIVQQFPLGPQWFAVDTGPITAAEIS